MLYSYRAKTQKGEIVKDEMDASSEIEVVRLLREKKLLVLDIKESGSEKLKIFFAKKVTAKDRLIFTKELAVMLQSGLAIVDTLENIKDQSANPELQRVIEEMIIDVRGGKSFSETLGRFPKVFPAIFVSIVKSGEKSGKLDKTIERLARQMEKDYEFQNKIRNALMYPVLIFATLIAVVIIAIVFIIPQIKNIFDEMDVALPITTRVLLGVSDVVVTFWWLILIIIVGLYFLLKSSLASKSFKHKWDRLILKIPIYGSFIKQVYMSRFLKSFETLITAGVPINNSLEISRNVIPNLIFEEALIDIQKKVENGEQLSESIKKEKIFPPMIPQMISVGEKSGKIEETLNMLSDFYDSEVENTTRNLTTILEPVLTIFMGIGIAFVVASIIMPIYGLVNAI